MTSRLIRFCLEHKLVVLLATIGIVVWGLIVTPFQGGVPGLPRDPVPVDAIPDIGENQQIVFTKWDGRSPQDVEDQVTYPLTVALLGVPGVKTVRSFSFFGFSSIYIIFEEDIEFYWSRSRVLEKLSSLPAGTLPSGVQPSLGPDATALGQVFWYTLEGRDPDGKPTGGWSLDELRTAQDWSVRYELLAAHGVAEVASVGGHVREYQVDVDPEALRAHGVSLTEVVDAVRNSNLDVGARTIEVNRVEYVVRGVGFVKSKADLEQVVVRAHASAPIRIMDVARVGFGPMARRGALDKGGAEAVGGVVVVRYGDNPLAAIENVKEKIERIAPGLPRKVVVDYARTTPEVVAAFATERGFSAYDGADLNQEAWVAWASKHAGDLPAWLTLSQVTIVPFYDRSDLIHETLETLSSALTEEILVCIIVVIAMLLHLRSSILVSGLLPLAVLMCFIAMKHAGVDANVVALSGIAIAIGTMVDMGVILCENILRHLEEAPPDADRLEVVHKAASEVGSAIVTAVATTVVSFLPVFAMEAAEGKLFKPLAFTKTFALAAAIFVALTILPPAAHLLFGRGPREGPEWHRFVGPVALAALGAVGMVWSVWVGLLVVLMAGAALARNLLREERPETARRLDWLSNGLAVLAVGSVLNDHWMPLGPDKGWVRNFFFTGGLIGGVLGVFLLFLRAYASLLRWCLDHKLLFLSLPLSLVVFGLSVWLGASFVFPWVPAFLLGVLVSAVTFKRWPSLVGEELASFGSLAAPIAGGLVCGLFIFIYPTSPLEGVRERIERTLPGLGQEFMPPLDEGSYLYMPTTMPHASIGESLDVLQKLDMAMASVPEVDLVVGKLGRADSPLDPAPISMIETVVNYKPEYGVDEDGNRVRQWREHIRSPDDIWQELVRVAQIPGTTSAPRLQPIAARLVMLQSGMRAPMGVKVKGPDLETIEQACLDIEALLKQVPSVNADAVIADRIVGKPYLEIEIDRESIARHGLRIVQVQDVIEVAIGGRPLTTTVEGRERYPVRVRYARELRDSVEAIGDIYVPTPDGHQIPLTQLADIRYVRGPQVIKSEDTQLVGYVLFDMRRGNAEVDVVEEAEAFLKKQELEKRWVRPQGVSYAFAGSYQQQQHAEERLRIVLPLALFSIFLLLYFEFKRISTTFMAFSAVLVAWAGGFLMLWLYAQPWFLDFSVFGTDMRQLFQVHPINLSVAVWVGFIAVFGVADDDAVIMATYLNQTFERTQPTTVAGVRAATLEAGKRRIRPCLMTTATTILALVPVLTSTGRGSDIMVPMAIPSFGGLSIVLITLFVVPTLYCGLAELRIRS